MFTTCMRARMARQRRFDTMHTQLPTAQDTCMGKYKPARPRMIIHAKIISGDGNTHTQNRRVPQIQTLYRNQPGCGSEALPQNNNARLNRALSAGRNQEVANMLPLGGDCSCDGNHNRLAWTLPLTSCHHTR